MGCSLGLIGSLAVASMQAKSQKETNEQNVALQHEAWEQQSISHRVQELEANGLNKQLATGMNPNYSLQTSVQSPMANLGNIFDYFKDIVGSDYQIQQKKNAEIQNEILQADKERAQAEADIKKHDADVITKREGVASNDSQFLRNIPGLGDMLFGEGQTSMWLRSLGETIKQLPEKAQHMVYEQTPDVLKPIVFGSEHKFVKAGGVMSGAKTPGSYLAPKTPSNYNSSMTSSNTRGWQAQKQSGGRYIQGRGY